MNGNVEVISKVLTAKLDIPEAIDLTNSAMD
jgi:hypothetical protein